MERSQQIAVEVRSVTKRYRRGGETVAALENISLSIKRGELVAITGASGSGKTTLAHIIGGLITPDEGDVLINGAALRKRNDRAMSKYRNEQVGFVFQNFSLIPYYTTVENVSVPMIVAGLHPAERERRAEKLLTAVGLSKKFRQRTDKLSGGERQRVSIARALAMQPKIIIADEPTGSLDSRRGLEIMAILEKLAVEQHITVILITHDPTLAARAHRQIELGDGKIVRGGKI